MLLSRFRRADASVLVVGSEPLEAMGRYRQTHPGSLEAGGVLLGRYLAEAPHVIIDEITVPMKGDKRMPMSFHRGHEEHQRLIDQHWHSTRGTCVYLGEWHTHPEPDPTPSSIDLRDWRRRLRSDVFDAVSLFFLILGTKKLRAWEGIRQTDSITPLTRLSGREP